MSDAHSRHEELLAARRAHHAAAHHLSCLLARFADEKLYLHLGYASIHEYGRSALDLTERQIRSFVRLGREVADLPALERAFASGDLGWTKCRELLRVVTADNVDDWVARARELTSRELEREVTATVLGERPRTEDEPERKPARQRLVFELEGPEADMVRQAVAWVCGQAKLRGEEIDRGAALAMLARRALHDAEADDAPTGERYRMVLEHCPECARTVGLDSEVTDTVVAEAACDAEVLDMRPGPKRGHVTRTVPPSVRNAVLHRDRWRCSVPGCRCRLWLDVHHLQAWAQGGDHSEGNLITLCEAHHRLLHRGLLRVEALGGGRVLFEHGDGRRRVIERGDPRGSRRRGSRVEAGAVDSSAGAMGDGWRPRTTAAATGARR